jgi:protein involved in temperature-dependent protein secretion
MTPYDTVERLIDKHGVADVLLMVQDVIAEKSAYIEATWQDYTLSGHWLRAWNVINQAVKALPKVPGIK